MNPLVYHIGSGQSFFSGLALLTFAALVPLWKRPVAKRLSAVAALLGIAGVLFSSTAIPYAIYALMLATFASWIGAAWRPAWRRYALVAWLLSIALALGWELPRHFARHPAAVGKRSLAVIGDSITAGVDDNDKRTWPRLLAAEYGLNVQDISHVGETAGSALKRLAKQPVDAPLVVLEIGGNDLLGTTSAAEFEADLDALLTALESPGRQLVMFELPLPPLCHEYGRVQRAVADKHRVLLIPKRVLLRIIAQENATIDGLHLSAAGQQRMAGEVWRVVGPAYDVRN